MRKQKFLILLLLSLLKVTVSTAQVDTLFWFAAPWVTPDHAFRDPYKIHLSGVAGTTVKIVQPAAIAPNKYDTIFTLPASGAIDYTFWRDAATTTANVGYDSLECRPANTVVPYGLKISSSSNITAVYDVITRAPNFYNPETFSLKGQNGLGTEFVCPFQTRRFNQNLGNLAGTPPGVDQPKQQINVVATLSNTIIWVTPRCGVVGHVANVTYSVLLVNAGDAYTIENLVQNTNVAGNNLSGTIVTSNKLIAVTVADDSVRGVTGCYDLMGDQIVPVDIVGREYIVIGGKMGATEFEGAYIVATENFTQVDINNGTPQAPVLLNKGDTYYFGVPTGTLCYVVGTKNIYVLHGTGFGCELGEALLPPMDCGGSNNIRFTRNNNQRYFLNVLCQSTITAGFVLNGNPALLTAADFTIVPGTGGFYSAAQREYSLAEIPISSPTLANLLVNNTATNSVFSLGVYNGLLTTGNMYHYMSLFFRKTLISTTSLTPICFGETPTVALSGTISGGVTNGYWTTLNGTGSLSPGYGSSAIYTLGIGDNIDTLRFRLVSDKNCKGDSVMAIVKLKVKKTPTVLCMASPPLICKNNATFIALTGTVGFGIGSWSGGNGGSFGVPGSNTTYTFSLADLSAGTITLTLTGTSTLGCLPTATTVTVGFTDPPVPNPGSNTIICTNSSSLILNGSIPGYTNGLWNSTGTGLFFPNNGVPTTTYVLSISDLTMTSIVFSLTSIPNPSTGCAPETRTVVANIIPAPFISAGPDFSVCASNTAVILSGTISGAATTGFWTTVNGGGTFPPPNAVPTATYLMGPNDPIMGRDTMVLHSDIGTCPSVNDTLIVYIVSDPVLTVPTNTTVCDNAFIALSGTVTGAVNTGYWTVNPGGGAFVPSFTALGAQYTPSAADLANGFVVITLHSDPTFCGLGPTKSFTVFITNSPNAAFNYPVLGRCLGSAVTFTDVSALNGSPFLTYNWNFGDTTATSIAQNPVHTYTGSGSYLVTLTVTGNGCPDTVTRRVNIAPLPISDFTVSNSCQGSNAIFKNLSQSLPGGGFINTWLWTFGDEAIGVPPTITGIPTTTLAHIYANANIYVAALTVSTSLGCRHTSTQTLNISPKPDAEFGMTNNPNVAQEPVYFSDFSTPPANIFSWYWQFGDEATDDNQATSHSYENAGIYIVKLTITDKNGCTDTTSKSIEINLLPQVPTAFTPNGDNNNDLLFVKGGPFEKMLFRVYDNWGELLFETRDQKVGWDGKKNGVEQPVGVYVWTLDVDMYNNRQAKKNGDVSLMR